MRWIKAHASIVLISAAAFLAMLFASWMIGSLYLAMQMNLDLNHKQVQALVNHDKILTRIDDTAEGNQRILQRLGTLSENFDQRITANDDLSKEIIKNQSIILANLATITKNQGTLTDALKQAKLEQDRQLFVKNTSEILQQIGTNNSRAEAILRNQELIIKNQNAIVAALKLQLK